MALLSERKVRTEDDWLLVEAALNRMVAEAEENPHKLMHRRLNPQKALTTMRAGGKAHIVAGYLVYFDVGELWFSDQAILSELLIVRVEPGGTLKSVARFLEREARAAGATMVAVGTSFARSDRALSRLYQAAGFRPEAITLTLEPQ